MPNSRLSKAQLLLEHVELGVELFQNMQRLCHVSPSREIVFQLRIAARGVEERLLIVLRFAP